MANVKTDPRPFDGGDVHIEGGRRWVLQNTVRQRIAYTVSAVGAEDAKAQSQGRLVWPKGSYIRNFKDTPYTAIDWGLACIIAKRAPQVNRTDNGRMSRNFFRDCIAEWLKGVSTDAQPVLAEHEVQPALPELVGEDTRVAVCHLLEELHVPPADTPLGIGEFLDRMGIDPLPRQEGDELTCISADDAEKIRQRYSQRRLVTTPATEEEMKELRLGKPAESDAPAPADQPKPRRTKEDGLTPVELLTAMMRHEQGMYMSVEHDKSLTADQKRIESTRRLERVLELSKEIRSLACVGIK